MVPASSAPLWPSLLAAAAAAGMFALAIHAVSSDAKPVSPSVAAAIRPFEVNVPEEALVDLRRRIAETWWPDKETVPDRSQGPQLAKIQALVRYWKID